MSISLDCPACGRHLQVSVDHAGKRVRCPGCDSTISVPEVATYGLSQDPVKVKEDSPPRPREDAISRTPQAPPAGAEKACPNCGAGLPRKAVLCIDCGYDFRLGEQRETESRLFAREWDSGMGNEWRVVGLVAMELLVFPFLAAWLFVITNSLEFSLLAFSLLVVFCFVLASLLFFVLVGTYAHFRVERTERGKTLLTRTLCIGFIPVGKSTMDPNKFKRILVTHRAGCNLKGYLIFLSLTLAMCCIPGIPIWVWLFLHSNYSALLEKKSGETVELYHGGNETKVRDLVEMMQELTDLPIER